MAYWGFIEDYNREKENYEKYLKRSRIVRLFEKIFVCMIIGAFCLIVIGNTIFNIEPMYLGNPELSIDYIYTVVTFTFLMGGFIGSFIMGKIHNNIKKECLFDNIKIDFINVYEAMLSYEKYSLHEIPVDKNDTIKHFEKSLKNIKDWEVGNIPFIVNKYETQIEFMQNTFKGILLYLLNSNDIKDIQTTKGLLYELDAFLYYEDEERLNTIYENAIKYEEKIIELEISTKDKIRSYIQNHQVISQAIVTSFLLMGTYYIGNKMEVTIQVMIPWFIAIFAVSFNFFKWIKETVFQMDK